MNRPMKNATQIITVLKPRPPPNRCRTGASSALSAAGTTKRSCPVNRSCGASFVTMLRSSASRFLRIRNGIEFGIVFRISGISSTGSTAA